MRRFLVIASLPVVLGALSCERNELERDELVIEPVAPVAVDTNVDRLDGRVALDRTERRGLGEGEIESTNQQLSDTFRKEIDGDPDLAVAAGHTRLVAEHDGDLVLRGWVPTLDLKQAIENYASVLAEQPVKNELDVKAPWPIID